MMAKIHNNPKLKEPRMPLILPSELEDKWLQEVQNEQDIMELSDWIAHRSADDLGAYTVNRLRGSSYLGNVEQVTEPFEYAQLVT